ncbi:MAG: hypothetical protein LC808_01680 [Actinobacteria bacterium]|nr:hypothetical protein [Actinomycetota bacterium]
MRALATWIRDLKAERNPGRFRKINRRVIAPGFVPLDVDDCLVRVAGVGPIADRPGSTPESQSVMIWMDTAAGQGMGRQHAVAEGLGALLTLISDRRIEVAAYEAPMAMEGHPDQITFVSYGQAADRRMYGPIEVDICSELTRWLADLASLEGKMLDVIGSAIDLHYGATLLFEKDVTAAYVLLVAALETLSRQFGTPPSTWEDWEQSTAWDHFATTACLTEEQAAALRDRLMRDRSLRLRETFARYGAERLPDSFWSQPWREWLFGVEMQGSSSRYIDGDWQESLTMSDFLTKDRDLLRSSLRRTYDARSGFVHQGDRLVHLMTEFEARVGRGDTQEPLMFPVLRSIVAGLIKLEVAEEATGFQLPDIRLTHGIRQEEG